MQPMNETDLLASHTKIKSKRKPMIKSTPSPSELEGFIVIQSNG
jgi:hypothetical protein